MGLGFAAGWAFGRFPLYPASLAENPRVGLALLADAHLQDGDEGRAEARALARAVAEIRGLRPAPDLVLFAGDLAHDGDAKALALGQEILCELPAPILAVPGEGDRGPDIGGAWPRLFGPSPFLYSMKGVNLLGLDTAWQNTPQGPAFALGEGQRRWLAAALSRLDPEKPLIVLSHAPLTPIFRPWGQWTADAAGLAPLLAGFHQVVCLHGHVHQAGVRGQGPGTSNCFTGFGYNSPLTENRKQKTENLSIPATAWPFPSPLQGTPRKLRPGFGPHGCGWVQLSVRGGGWEVQPHSWQA